MDNLTHSLIGAALAQAGLKRRTGLAMPAAIIAANLPDIDAPCVVFGVRSLAMRRGITHGPIALIVLPLLLAALLIAFDRWQKRRGRRPMARTPVNAGWLIAICYLAALTHPAFDWLNTYGIRLLEPFSSRWFYGDALFIIDPWLLAMLGVGVWLSLRRERAGADRWTRPAHAALAAVMAYVFLNIAISRHAAALYAMDGEPEATVASPVPLAFWRREILWRSDHQFGSVHYTLLGPAAAIDRAVAMPTNMRDPRIADRARASAAARALLFWSRMPVAEIAGDTILLKDQRFMQGVSRGPFMARLPPQ